MHIFSNPIRGKSNLTHEIKSQFLEKIEFFKN
jgi:hypothetical protein